MARRAVTFVVFVGVFAFLLGWAIGTVFRPAVAPGLEASEPLLYRVEEETISRDMRFTAMAEWSTEPGPRSSAVGVVTDVAFSAGDELWAGDVLFAVNLRPTVVAEGDVPMFRDIQRGDNGPDIAQLQELLKSLGFLDADHVAGEFDRPTERAVEVWQEYLGVSSDGVVRRSDVVFTEYLPRRFAPGPSIRVGDELTGGVSAVLLLSETPQFWVPLSLEQRRLVPTDRPVVVDTGTESWSARVVEVVEVPERGIVNYVLGTAGSSAICGSGCASIPLDGPSEFVAVFQIVAPTTGPAVPTAALRTSINGSTYVITADGSPQSVDIVVSVGGIAIVSGVDLGVDVVIGEVGSVED